MKPIIPITISFLLLSATGYTQAVRDGVTFQRDYQLHISKTTADIKIDGDLDDSVWLAAEAAGNFWRKYPNDEGRAKRRTEIRTVYDDKNIYFAITCYDSGKAVIQSLKRDVGHDGNDGIGIILDPNNRRTNGFFFVLNAFNAQSEDQLSSSSGEEKLSYSWDNKWYSATKQYSDRWTAEIAIPFKTLRYDPGKTTWGINFVRIDVKNNEYSVWTHVPVNFRSYDLGYTGALQWNQPPPDAGKNMVFIPYTTGGANQDKENNKPLSFSGNAGFDSKITLNAALNLDLTVNPDFSQVEVDQQVTNLTRFDLFFPEKRTFFLENSEIFGGYGIPGLMTPFYSRRIGLDQNGNRIPILGGARLSGNLTKQTRIGVMNIQTGSKGDYAAENYTALSVNHNLFGRSLIKGYFLDRESFLSDAQKLKDPLSKYGRNAGMELVYTNLQGTWNVWSGLHKSFKPGITKDDYYLQGGGSYSNRNFNATLDLVHMGTNYYTDMGFVQRIDNYDAARDTTIRVGFSHIFAQAGYKIFPVKGNVSQHKIDLESYSVFNPDKTLNEQNSSFKFSSDFRNASGFMATLTNDVVNLLYPIKFTDGDPLPAAHYNFTQASLMYYSDSRKILSYNVLTGGGSFYNGNILTMSAGITYRNQPHINITLQGEYDKLHFPGKYGTTELFLLSPKVEINFSTKVFWTTFLQYNTQAKNFNINSRFQYRFKPMSDLYLVYTDNYFTSPIFTNKNRAIVFKLNYWLNI